MHLIFATNPLKPHVAEQILCMVEDVQSVTIPNIDSSAGVYQ